MGYALVTGTCCCCGGVFSFNPVRVPSATVRGTREPICSTCIVQVNQKRKEAGLATWPVYPDSYEAVDERELQW